MSARLELKAEVTSQTMSHGCVVARREIVVSMYEGLVVVMGHSEKFLQTDVGDPDLWDSRSGPITCQPDWS